MKKTLVVLAAGMGSRYGGLKQIDQLGPAGEAMLEYSVFDALRAGFSKIIFIIRKDFEDAFRKEVGDQFNDFAEVAYCYQELNDLPNGFELPGERTKPWGTGHALLSTRKVVKEPFLIINADDFYGRESYELASKMLDNWGETKESKVGMIGFRLDQTLSENGTVSRGICDVDQGKLVKVEETHEIKPAGDFITSASERKLTGALTASMNMWCLTPNIFNDFEKAFSQFLAEKIEMPKSEFYIPFVIDDLIQAKKIECEVVQSPSQWFGVTYQEDKDLVVESIQKAVDAGVYPIKLADEFCTVNQ